MTPTIFHNPSVFDCYTIVYSNGGVYGASRNPFSPNGYGQYVGTCQELRNMDVAGFIAEADTEKHLGERVDPMELPDDVKEFVRIKNLEA